MPVKAPGAETLAFPPCSERRGGNNTSIPFAYETGAVLTADYRVQPIIQINERNHLSTSKCVGEIFGLYDVPRGTK